MKFNYFNAGSTSKGASFKRIVRAGRLNKSRTNKNEHYAINAINSTRKFNRQRVVTTGFKHGIPLPVARCTKRRVNQENASRFLFISNSQTFPNDDDIRPGFYSGPIKKLQLLHDDISTASRGNERLKLCRCDCYVMHRSRRHRSTSARYSFDADKRKKKQLKKKKEDILFTFFFWHEKKTYWLAFNCWWHLNFDRCKTESNRRWRCG